MGCQKLNIDFFNALEVIHPKKRVSEEKKRINYYPFGLKHKGYNNNIVSEHNWKFQGQELTEDLGLNMYEFKWRMHDPAIGRFMQIDPLAEDYVYNSTYAFAENRVIDGFELEGLEWVDVDDNLIYDPSKNEDGEVRGFTEHATQENKDLAAELNKTETGQEQFGKLVNAEVKVVVELNKTDSPTKDGIAIFGSTNTGENNNGDEIQKITLFEKNITPMEKEINRQAGIGNDMIQEDGSKIKGGIDSGSLLGATLGHEVEHTTPNNMKLRKRGASLRKIEQKPTAVGNKILSERNKQRNKKKKG